MRLSFQIHNLKKGGLYRIRGYRGLAKTSPFFQKNPVTIQLTVTIKKQASGGEGGEGPLPVTLHPATKAARITPMESLRIRKINTL